MFLLALVALQAVALVVLAVRLAPGRTRRPPVAPRPEGGPAGGLTILLPTLNEARRLAPCLEGLMRQGAPVEQILVIDSDSKDGTRDLVRAAAERDPRIRLIPDRPLAPGWVGKAWALQYGAELCTTEWFLTVDADTAPVPGMAAAALAEAQAGGYDALSFSPRFSIPTAGERWLQPALLITLVYRTGAAGAKDPAPDNMLANGQCSLFRRDALLGAGGYAPVRQSFSEDVSLARHLARSGRKVGFLDGSRLYTVRAYETAAEAWREWGRSLDLKDATTPARQWFDVVLLWLAQGLPLAILLAVLAGAWPDDLPAWTRTFALSVNGALVAIRLGMLAATRGAYERTDLPFWLSPLADPLAAWRITLSTLRRPKGWRGRTYDVTVPA